MTATYSAFVGERLIFECSIHSINVLACIVLPRSQSYILQIKADSAEIAEHYFLVRNPPEILVLQN